MREAFSTHGVDDASRPERSRAGEGATACAALEAWCARLPAAERARVVAVAGEDASRGRVPPAFRSPKHYLWAAASKATALDPVLARFLASSGLSLPGDGTDQHALYSLLIRLALERGDAAAAEAVALRELDEFPGIRAAFEAAHGVPQDLPFRDVLLDAVRAHETPEDAEPLLARLVQHGALSRADAARALHGLRVKAAVREGRRAMDAGAWARAAAAFERASRGDATLAATLFEALARACAASGDHARAAEFARKAEPVPRA